MDNEVAMTRENSSTGKSSNKRRSFVFKRQSIVLKEQDLNTNLSEEVSQVSKKFKSHHESQSKPFDINKYIENLKEEDKKWREVYGKRKSRVQETIKRDKYQVKIGQSLDITSLTDSERAFLRAKPDYEEFNKNVFQLHAMATKVSFLNSCAKNFYEKSTSKLQNDTDNIMYRIIQISD